MQFSDIPPSSALIDWAAQEAVGIRLPLDRPWYQVPSPASNDNQILRFPCRCGDGKLGEVESRQYQCEDDQGYVYIGQCRRCEALFWAYKGKEAKV